MSYTAAGAADAGSIDSSKGTITVKISTTKLNALLPARAAEAGSSGVVVAFAPIDQGWSPFKFTLSPTAPSSK